MNRRTFLGVIPAAAAMAAGAHPKAAALPAIIPVIGFDDEPPAGPAILMYDKAAYVLCPWPGLLPSYYYIPMLNGKLLWTPCTLICDAGGSRSTDQADALIAESPYMELAHRHLNMTLSGEMTGSFWIWAATYKEARVEDGRVLGLDPA